MAPEALQSAWAVDDDSAQEAWCNWHDPASGESANKATQDQGWPDWGGSRKHLPF